MRDLHSLFFRRGAACRARPTTARVKSQPRNDRGLLKTPTSRLFSATSLAAEVGLFGIAGTYRLIHPRKLPQRQFLRPHIPRTPASLQRRLNPPPIRNPAQIIPQCLPLLPEASLHELKKPLLIRNPQPRPFPRQLHPHQSRRNLRRRPKRPSRNPQLNLRPRIKLAQSRKIPVSPPSGPRHNPLRNFQLNHNVNRSNAIGHSKQMPQNRRSNVVRQIPINTNPISNQRRQIDLQNISRNNFHSPPSPSLLPQPLRQPLIRLNRHNTRPSPRQQFRHLAMPRPNFKPTLTRRHDQRLQNLLPPTQITKKMLSQLLSRHSAVEFSNFAAIKLQGSS